MKEEQIQTTVFPQALSVAKRDPVSYRYDILDWDFINKMAQIAHYGAEKYGEFNWHKSELKGDKSPKNHMQEHYRSFLKNLPYEKFDGDPTWHLVAIAFNAMMQYYYEVNRKGESNVADS